MHAKLWRYAFHRNFSNSAVRRNLEKPTSETSASSDSSSPKGFVLAKMPSNFEKRILIFSGRYKTMEEIPKLVASETLENCKSKIRIKVANLMILITVITCGVIIYNGKALRRERIKKLEETQGSFMRPEY